MKTILKDGTILNSHDLPDYIAKEIKKHNNFYEFKLLNKLKEMNVFGDGDIIEIGANIGNHVVFYKMRAGIEGKIYAFEPLKNNYEILEKNIKDNNLQNVDIKKYGLGDKNESATFFVNETNFGNSSLIMQKYSSKKVDVEIREVTDELKILMNSSSFAKIDIEGAEKFIFDKLINAFKKDNFRFLIELNMYEYSTLDEYMKQFKKIREAGFKLIFMPDSANFLWSSWKSDVDTFSEKKISKNYCLYQIKLLRNEYDASSSSDERNEILKAYKKMAKKIFVPFNLRMFWSKIYLLFRPFHALWKK